MAGQTILKLLEARDYQSFLQLTSTLGKEVLIHLTVIAASGNLIEKIMGWEGREARDEDSATQAVTRHANELVRVGSDMKKRVEDFLYPRSSEGKLDIAFNEQRWAPYDGQAWDAFYAEFVALLGPHVATLEPLVRWAADMSADIHDEKAAMYARTMTPVVERLSESLDKLEALLLPETFEEFLARL